MPSQPSCENKEASAPKTYPDARPSTLVGSDCSELVRYALSSCCHSEERSDEESTISPPLGERYREGVFAIQLTKTE